MTVEQDMHALEARVARLEQGQQEHATELDEVRMRLGALQSGVDRLYSKATQQGLTLDKQTITLERVQSLLEQLVRQHTPSVEVAGAR